MCKITCIYIYVHHKDNEDVSSTLQVLLSAISQKCDQSLPALLIGNIITSIVSHSPTDLQVSLAVLLRNFDVIVGQMFDYHITCSYNIIIIYNICIAPYNAIL